MIETLAIVIGIGNYEQRLFYPDIPGAVADARWVRRSLLQLGLPNENINVLINDRATRREILRALRIWTLQRTSGPIRLLLFFSCHGCKVQEERDSSCSVLLPYDSDPQDSLGTGLKLSDVILALRRLDLIEVYLFIDACYQSLNNLENVLSAPKDISLSGGLPDQEILNTSGARCFLCMVAASNSPAYESQRGFFTNAILKKLEALNHVNSPNISLLISEVESELRSQGLPSPTVYMIGQTNLWPFSSFNTSTQNIIHSDNFSLEVHRTQVLSQLKRTLREIYPKSLALSGDSGLGKTFILNQLLREVTDSVYVSIVPDGAKSLNDIEDQIATAIAEKVVTVFPSGIPFASAKKTFEAIGSKARGFLVILDHAERIANETLLVLIDSLKSLGIQVLLGTRLSTIKSINLLCLDCPLFSLEETQKLIETLPDIYANPIEVLARTGGNPLKIKHYLLQTGDVFSELYSSKYSKLINAVSVSFGFIDIDIFSENFELEKKHIYDFIELGLIQIIDNKYVPHDSIVSLSSFSIDDYRRAQSYWVRQMLLTRKMIYSARMLAICILRTRELAVLEDRALEWALEELWSAKEWLTLKELTKLIHENLSILEISVFKISEILIEQGNIKDTKYLIASLMGKKLKNENQLRANLLIARYNWWLGNYSETLKLASDILSNQDHIEYHPHAYLEKAIAHFFLGEWNVAKHHLTLADNPSVSDPRTIGWSRLIAGTIDGIRGTLLVEGILKLESSIRILEQIDDYFGLCIAYGNLGEVYWKSGQLDKAWIQLQKGLQCAVDVGNDTNQLENKRNQLHIIMRLEGTETQRFNNLFNEILSLDTDNYGDMEKMQVYNTLATGFAYKNKTEECYRYFSLAAQITQGNEEYDIYTLGNRCLFHLLKNELNEAFDAAIKAVNLAINGENYLAIRQIKDDVEYVTRLHCTNGFSKVLSFLTEQWEMIQTVI